MTPIASAAAPRTALEARGLRPVADLAKCRPHGDRLRYLAGCRCADCRRANTAYETARAAARKAGDWNGIVPAATARAHLAALSHSGIGRRTVADVAGIADTVLSDIIAGRKSWVRARTERRILAVTTQAAADRALIDARPTWRLLTALLELGYSKAELARQLGYTSPALQLGRRRVTVRSAHDVQRLYARLEHCSARRTLQLLANLAAEGYRRERVLRLLAELASTTGADAPDLTVRRGRVRKSTARLVEQLHQQLTT